MIGAENRQVRRDYGSGQEQSRQDRRDHGFGQTQTRQVRRDYGFGQTQTRQDRKDHGFGQTQGRQVRRDYGFGQAQTRQDPRDHGFGQTKGRQGQRGYTSGGRNSAKKGRKWGVLWTGREKKQKVREDLPDYGIYKADPAKTARIFAEYGLLDLAVSLLFYNSWIAFLIFLPGVVFYFRRRKKDFREQRFASMRREFLDGMQFTGTALQSGYAMENAFSEALVELRKIYPEDAFIVREFRQIAVQIKMNVPIERLLNDLGNRSHIEDIRNFSEIFHTARVTGGDMIAIVRNTASNMRQKEETLQEIETVLSGKMMEQKIMSVIPLAILAYVRLTDPGFLAGMYHSFVGICIMTGCLSVYLIAYFWGQSIMNIRV